MLIGGNNHDILHVLRDERTHAHSLGEGVEINVSQYLGYQKASLGKRLLTQPCLFKVADISSKLLFYGSSMMAPFKNPQMWI